MAMSTRLPAPGLRRRVGAAATAVSLMLLGTTLPAKAQNLNVTALQAQAASGDANAQFKLGTVLYVGLDVIQDYVGAATWLQRAADQGNADAQCELGFLFQTGSFAQGPPLPDPKSALPWYKKAAAQHNGCGEYALANLYSTGIGVDSDSDHAAKLLHLAEADGFSAPAGIYALQALQDHFYGLAYRFVGSSGWSDTVSAQAGGGG